MYIYTLINMYTLVLHYYPNTTGMTHLKTTNYSVPQKVT